METYLYKIFPRHYILEIIVVYLFYLYFIGVVCITFNWSILIIQECSLWAYLQLRGVEVLYDQNPVDISRFMEGMDIVFINLAKLVGWQLASRVSIVIIFIAYLPSLLYEYLQGKDYIFLFISNLHLGTVLTT